MSGGRLHPQARRPRSITEAAHSLEELLNVAGDQPRSQPAPAPRTQSRPEPTAAARRQSLNEQAKVLVRAMIGAARSDGQITPEEQASIIEQLGDTSRESIDFLRQEFRQPVDARQLAWSTPRGMEEQVYTVSLLAIELDEQKEADYLADLCQGLRLDPLRCNEIHRRYNAPVIFQT